MTTTSVDTGSLTTGSAPVQDPPSPDRAPFRRRAVLPLVGILGGFLSTAGLAGVGDAPDPHDTAAQMAAHFLEHRDAVLASAPLGYLGATGIAAFSFGLARRLYRAGRRSPAVLVAAGGAGVAMYMFAIHVVYTTLAFQIAGTSAEATKSLFMLTIMATPAYGFATAVMVGATAWGMRGTGILPRWLLRGSAAGAFIAVLSFFGLAESDFWYPDNQQQFVANVALLFIAISAITLLVRAARRRDHRKDSL